MTIRTILAAALLAAPSLAIAQTEFDVTLGLGTEGLFQQEQFGFDGTAYAGAGVTGQAGVLQYRLALGTNEDGDPRLDGSYAHLATGAWVFGAGQVDRNWGPSRTTSVILSSNARPFPSVYIRKDTPTAVDLPVLEWLGPWDFETFIGQLEEDRAVPNTKTFGMRIGINPAPGLVINLERTAQWGGEGRAEDLEAFFNMLIGNTNQDTAADDPANQLAGISVSYELPERIAPLRFYAQLTGEDEAANLPTRFMHLAGVELDTPIGGIPSLLTLEMVDTRVDSLGLGDFPNIAYQNRFYPSGYTFDGRVMGAAIDTDGLSIRLSGAHRFDAFQLDWGIAQISINEPGTPAHRLSSVPVSGLVADLGGTYTFDGGLSLRGGVTWQGFELDTAGIPEGISAALLITRTF